MAPPPPPPPPPPPQLSLPFKRARQLTGLTHHPNDSASTATLTSVTSAATKLHFTEDTESYFHAPLSTPSSGKKGTPNVSRTASSGSVEKPRPTPGRMWTWRRHDSTSTLIGDQDNFKTEPEVFIEKVDTGIRIAALRKKMTDDQIDYL
jgi:hypothetical protein